MGIHYQSERLRIMTSKTLLAGLLTTLVFLILIEFSNSNPSGIRQVSSDGKENGLLELESKDEPLVRQKRSTARPTAKPTAKSTTRKPTNSTTYNTGSPILLFGLLFLS